MMIRILPLILALLIHLPQLSFCSEFEINLGRSVSATIFGKYEPIQNKSLIRYVNLVGQSIVSTSGRRDINFYFAILDSPSIEAFAAPGGYIFITKGLLDIIQTEAELAGILAHEIAHVNLKHVLNKVYSPEKTKQNFLSRLLNARNTSFQVALNEVSDKATQILLNEGLNENDEYESDIAAIFYMQNTGYNCQSYLNIISRLPKHSTISHSKTHPSMNKRIESIKVIFSNLDFSEGSQLAQRFNDHAKN